MCSAHLRHFAVKQKRREEYALGKDFCFKLEEYGISYLLSAHCVKVSVLSSRRCELIP